MKVKSQKIIQDGDCFLAFDARCPEANGQGKTRQSALKNLKKAIDLIRYDNEFNRYPVARKPSS